MVFSPLETLNGSLKGFLILSPQKEHAPKVFFLFPLFVLLKLTWFSWFPFFSPSIVCFAEQSA
jgi:hypothetical protein